mmetsp:Transcript_22326/g.76449  ORF Transcript_22326/g.76449 Transcript_22326/m.76449 type:complete len:230 (+) Transcript_22326:266-955(+)
MFPSRPCLDRNQATHLMPTISFIKSEASRAPEMRNDWKIVRRKREWPTKMATPPPPGCEPLVRRSWSTTAATRARMRSSSSPVIAPHHSSRQLETSTCSPRNSSTTTSCSLKPSYKSLSSLATRTGISSPTATPVESAPPIFFCSRASLSNTSGRSSESKSPKPMQAVQTARVKGELYILSGLSSSRVHCTGVVDPNEPSSFRTSSSSSPSSTASNLSTTLTRRLNSSA